MNLPTLLAKLRELSTVAEEGEFEDDYIDKLIIDALLDYINNDKIREAIDDIPF